MYNIRFRLDDSELKRLTRAYPEISRRVRMSHVTEALLLLEREIKRSTPYGAGPIHLRDTIAATTYVAGEQVGGAVGTPLEHGEPVEMGTRPHFPPIGPLAFWVEKKMHLDGKEAKAVAFLIARAISRRGTKPRRMFGDAADKFEGQVMGILSGIPAAIVSETERL